ncbi:MAG: UDP-2,3-diacylglucosamine diphosphatase [Myxococcales bacterium]|nr:UDP-2,3-diacylglucosamine diphosphatase [Myxococcales bacterium]
MHSGNRGAEAGQGRATLFVGDAHLRPGEPERTRKLARFFDAMASRVEAVYIVGDLFDFWIGHRRSLAEPYRELFERLARMRAAGVRFYYVGGNHDFFVGAPFTEDLGAESADEEIPVTLGGRRGLVVHGDLVNPRDYGYRFLRWLLRTRVVYWLTLLIPAALLTRIAEGMSRTSRRYTRTLRPPPFECFRAFARAARARGFDFSVMGHFHTPGHHRIEGPAGTHDLYIVGDWFTQDQYVLYEDGRFRLERFEG